MNMKAENYKVIDLFCGCGGLSLGFQNAGYQIASAFDWWDAALNIYQLDEYSIDEAKASLREIEPTVVENFDAYYAVCHLRNDQVRTDMLRATMKQMEETLQGYPMIVRCHRAFLVNLGQVEQIISHSGSTQLLIKHCHESLPVSRSNMSQVKAAINNH